MITGLGVVAPNGIGKDAFWQNLIAGKSGIDWITSFDASKYPSRVAAEIRSFNPTAFMQPRIAKSVGRFTHLAIAAGLLAVRDAKLPEDLGNFDPGVGIAFGTSAHGAADIAEENHRRFLYESDPHLNPVAMLECSAHAATSHVSQILKTSGPTATLASGCATGLDVVAWGLMQVKSHNADLAIVGAAEAPISEFIFAMFAAGGFLSSWEGPAHAASRPFDLLRAGLVLAEASGAIVIEELDHALERGAHIYAEIAGYGSASEGGFDGNRREVYRQGLELAALSACRQANKLPSHIDYVNAHGNSTRDDDAADTAAYKKIMGAHAFNVPISSIKSAIGQPLSAGAILQVAATALSIENQLVPPTINLEYRDPECDLDYVPQSARRARVRTALVHAHSLGGLVPGSHGALILARLDAPE